MDSLILEAHRVAADKRFFTITKTLERLLLNRYGTTSKLKVFTTRKVLAILQHNQLEYSI